MERDQRYTARASIALNTLINYDQAYPRIGKTRDLSMGGAFVEMRRVDVPLAAAVEIVLILERIGEYGPHRLPARVIRVASDGVALKFDDYGDDTYAALVTLLYPDAPPATAI